MTINRPKLNKGKRVEAGASANSLVETDNETPTFCFRYVDPDFCITCCGKDDIAQFAKHLRKFCQMTWRQIILADRHGLGREKIASSSLKRPIPNHLTDDVTFIALRFSGLKPMVGYRSGNTFHAIWFDRDMKGVYDH